MREVIYRTRGIIIRKADLGEADRLFTIYTREYGKIQARAISVKKAESKLKGYLELFNYADFGIARSKTIDIITDVIPINNFLSLRVSLPSITKAFYVSELLDKLMVGPEKDDYLWQLVLKTFQELDTSNWPVDFEIKLLSALGYAIPTGQQAIDCIQAIVQEKINSASAYLVHDDIVKRTTMEHYTQ